MWRFLNGISRAVKNHIHSPRPSAGLYVEEEPEALELNEKPVVCPFSGRRRKSVDNGSREKPCCSAKVLNSLFAYKRTENHDTETTCDIEQCHDFNTGRQGEKKQKWSCHHDFWRLFQRSHHVLEAISWGTAALWGGDVERRRHKTRILFRILFTSPSSNTTVKAINSSVTSSQLQTSLPHVNSQVTGKDTSDAAKDVTVSSLEAESLDSALEEFQSMCAEYTARNESLLGIEAAVHGDFSTAVEHLHSSSTLGNLSACFNLGLCYETGTGVEQDLDKAKHYYKMAAMGGHSMALYNLGLMRMSCSKYNTEAQLAEADCSCGCNRVEGLGLLEKAAKLGLAEAQTYLGIHHIGERQDVDKAVPYFKAAADQNDAEAQYFLAICYEQGLGVEVNECRAAQLYSQAASAGHELATYNLGVFNERGLGGLPQDKSAAIELYQKSMDLGCEQARQRLEELKASQATAEGCKTKVESFHQHHRDDTESSRHMHAASLSPSASSPNLIEYLHKDIPFFFGSHSVPAAQDKRHDRLFDPGGHKVAATPRSIVFHLGSDGDDDDESGSLSPLSERSQADESFESLSNEIFPSFKNPHKSHSHPNFAMAACNI